MFFPSSNTTIMKKLSGFRQLSLNCDTPPTPPRRPPLRKQFSEDISDFKTWPEHDIGMKISLNNRSLRNPFIKNAWLENTQDIDKEEPVIIKRCSENRRITNPLIRQASIDKETVLNGRQELADRLKNNLKSQEEKPNIKIFLAQNSKEQIDEYDVSEQEDKPIEQPKLIRPLIVNNDKNSFKLRKNAKQKISLNNNTSNSSRPVPNRNKNSPNSPVIVVPVIENELERKSESILFQNNMSDVKAINSVIIRPATATAASKREMFQKRTNSAFNATVNIKETQKLRRPLVRSSSAPCKPEQLKSKIMLTKHSRYKQFKKMQIKNSTKQEDTEKEVEDNSKSQKELNRSTAVQGTDVVTMVSLISPTGSDCEEEEMEEVKTKNKTVSPDKNNAEQKLPPKIMSLRKAVKTVSFQQSSIHAIRSFSASFPARRASVTAAMMLNNSLNSSTVHINKVQEKRSTNSSTPDDDERVPKRRLLRSNTEETNTASLDQQDYQDKSEESDNQNASMGITNLNIEEKNRDATERQNTKTEQGINSEKPETSLKETEDGKEKETEKESEPNPDLQSPKEKQCWNMYCKMSEKGINISFDTILRGMLTPTEYRLSKKHLDAATNIEPTENPK